MSHHILFLAPAAITGGSVKKRLTFHLKQGREISGFKIPGEMVAV
jgi:hypothetical protein